MTQTSDTHDPKVYLHCPDCGSEMRFITEDMSDQGGPPENTWLCLNQTCGRAIEAADDSDF